MTDIFDEAARAMYAGVDKALLEQLGDLVKKGILVVHQRIPTITDDGDNQFTMSTAVRIVSKEHEYIANLEARNLALEKLLEEGKAKMATLRAGLIEAFEGSLKLHEEAIRQLREGKL